MKKTYQFFYNFWYKKYLLSDIISWKQKIINKIYKT